MHSYRLIRPLLFALPPEMAHGLALLALKSRLLPPASRNISPSLAVHAFGLDFPSPIGLAAGFDKNAESVDALLAQGFGFVEAGTCTPRAQKGNPRPRLFRLPEDESLINRLGFNNRGAEVFTANLQKRRRAGIVGANIGKNRDSADAAADYVYMLKAVAAHADYITVNVSSPNTQGLRALQEREALRELLSALQEARKSIGSRVPLLLKIAPDIRQEEQEAIADVAMEKNLEGLIVSNTTISRPESLRSRFYTESGGLSGRALFPLSTEVLRSMHRLTGGNIPLIGVGGVMNAEDAYAKIRAGATLVQLYTGLVYRGFGLLNEIHRALPHLLARDGFKSAGEAVGAESR